MLSKIGSKSSSDIIRKIVSFSLSKNNVSFYVRYYDASGDFENNYIWDTNPHSLWSCGCGGASNPKKERKKFGQRWISDCDEKGGKKVISIVDMHYNLLRFRSTFFHGKHIIIKLRKV